MKKSMMGIALVIACGVTWAQDDSADFNEIFVSTCMQNFFNAQKLATAITKFSATKLDKTDTEKLIGGQSGSAWIIEYKAKRFVVTSNGDTGLCSLLAFHGSYAHLQTAFHELVAPAPAPFKYRSPQTMPSSIAGVTTVSHGWTREGSPTELNFTLSTHASPGAPIKAIASAGVAKAE